MTERQIEADEEPCPLTVGEWMIFLAAESQVKSGDKILAVTMLLMFSAILMAAFSIILPALREIHFEDGRGFIGLISVAVLCVVSVILICCAYRTVKCFRAVMGIFWERNKIFDTIEEIIAGKLTDPDEIRKRWRDRGAPANAGE